MFRMAVNQKKKDLLTNVKYLITSQKNTYYTSVTTRTDQFESVLETSNYSSGIKKNLFLAPDFKLDSNMVLANRLMELGIPEHRIALIIAADRVKHDSKEMYGMEKYLAEHPNLDQVILTKGSSQYALKIEPVDSQYMEIAKLIKKYRHDLALVVNPYQQIWSFNEEIKRKEVLQPKSYISQPIFDPGALPDPIREQYQEWMRDPNRGVSIGILKDTEQIYRDRRLNSTDLRTTSEGRDRYDLTRPVEPLKTLSWIIENMKDRPPEDLHRAVYTRIGFGHEQDAYESVVKMFTGTELDAAANPLAFGLNKKGP
jgi:hypothetical protein